MTETIGPDSSRPAVQDTIESFNSIEASIRAKLAALMAALLTADRKQSLYIRLTSAQT